MRTDPKHFLFRMLLFLAIVFTICLLLVAPIKNAFLGNPVLNGVILATLGIGILFVFRQILRLTPERNWLLSIQKTGSLDTPEKRPILLATVYAMLADSRHDAQLSALSLRSVLDGVAARLDEGREISRYMIGLLVFLGLLGTFWGLLQTIGAVSQVIYTLDAESANFESMMAQLRAGLDAPLSGMATAFSSSLFGLAGSLILGFLDLQLGQAMGRFFNELEDWLSAFARFNDNSAVSGAHGALANGMSEEAARALLSLSQSIAVGETNRTKIIEQMSNLNSTMAVLNEAMVDDRRIREQLAELNASLKKLSEELHAERSHQTEILKSELRSLTQSIAALIGNSPIAKKGK